MLNFVPGLLAAGLAVCGMGLPALPVERPKFQRSRSQQGSAITPACEHPEASARCRSPDV